MEQLPTLAEHHINGENCQLHAPGGGETPGVADLKVADLKAVDLGGHP